jgi:hypothetical protein
MGYRASSPNASRRASCDARGCRWPRSPAASASPRAACRCGSATCRSTRSPARRGRPRSTGWSRRVGSGSGGCRSASSWSRGSRCTREKRPSGMAPFASPIATRACLLFLLLASTVLRDRRVPPAGPPLSARRPRPGGLGRLLVVGDRDPSVTSSGSRTGRFRTHRSATSSMCMVAPRSVTVAAPPTGASWGWSTRS